MLRVAGSNPASHRRPSFNPSYQTRKAAKIQRDYQMLGGEGLGAYDGGALPADVPLADEEKMAGSGDGGGGGGGDLVGDEIS